MNKRLIPKRPGYTLIEVLIVIVIMAILASIGVPYLWELVRGTEAVRAKPQMVAITEAAIDFHQERGDWPESVKEMVEKGYLVLDQSVSAIWGFSWDEDRKIVTAINRNPDKPNWNGKAVFYYMKTGDFAGFGVPAEQEEFPRGPQ